MKRTNKNFHLLALAVLGLFTTLALFACTGSEILGKLDTPTITLNNNVISWDMVEHADHYLVSVGSDEVEVFDTIYTIDIKVVGNYGVAVKAISKDETYIDSARSNVLTYVVYPEYSQLSAPQISIEENVITWNVVEHATSYNVFIGSNKFETTDTNYTITNNVIGTVSVFVIAKTSDLNYYSSLASNIKYYSSDLDMSEFTSTKLLNAGSWSIEGTYQEVIDMVNDRQLYDVDLWAAFVEQYRSNTDGDGNGWRGEFWGKMMEGASVTYNYTQDPVLYEILTNTVKDVLTTQQPNGSISSYGSVYTNNSDEFDGWDMWNRNWVMLGLEYYYNICQDEDLKVEIVESLEAQLNWIMKNVGPEEGQIGILQSASQWGGLPASTILEAVVKLYFLTDNIDYLNFASYIVDEGGSSFGDQFEQAYLNETLPYQWGAPKAGELTMLFDGILEYYYATGIEKYKTAAINYWYDVYESELTVVGGGCSKDEVFEHSVIEQADPTKIGAMQEHCVTIHWLNFSKDVFQLLSDSKIIDSMEMTFFNAMYGAVDNEHHYDHAFTSYNGLTYTIRSRSAAGGMHLEKPYPFDYGCCISQGSIATGLLPQIQQSVIEGGFLENLYLPGTTMATTESNNKVTFVTDTNYPKDGIVGITINPSEKETFNMGFRIPGWSEDTTVTVNGVEQAGVKAGEYFYIEREWSAGDVVVLTFDMSIRTFYGSKDASNQYAQYNVALMRGPITLARDARLDGGDIYETLDLATDENGNISYELTNKAGFETQVEVTVQNKAGDFITLVDYGSAGKTYDAQSVYSVFFPTTDYWIENSDYTNGVVLVNVYFESIPMINTTDDLFHMGNAYKDYTNLAPFTYKFVDADNGYYYLLNTSTNTYVTLVNDKYFGLAPFTGDDNQQFELGHVGLMTFMITAKNGYLMSANNEYDAIWLYNNVNSTKQYWYLYTSDTQDN